MNDPGLAGLADWPGLESAAGWVRADGTTARAGDATAPFALASVTKLFTAVAVLVAVQEEIVALDETAGPPGSTIRMLLCHASGLPFEGTEPIADAGTRRIYGNAAYELLGDIVSERSGLPFADYVREGVLVPLGMLLTTATGSPAHGGRSNVDDMLRFAEELLHPGRVLAPELLQEATTPQLPKLAGVLPGFGPQAPNPWGLGFELRGHKAPHWTPHGAAPETFGHFGQSGAFVWVDPTAGVACTALSSQPFGRWALHAWPALGGAVLEAAR